MKSNSKQTKTNKNQNVNVTKKTNEAKQESYATELFDKPMMEYANPGIPLTLKLLPGDHQHPTLIDTESYDKSFIVEDQNTYTIRLGMRSCPLGAGSMDADTMAACLIPAETAEAIRIFGMFFIPEIYPAIFLDTKILCTKNPSQKFRLVYEQGSAVLESNNLSRGLALDHDVARLEDDKLIIFQHGLHNEIPYYTDFTYDFISFRVRVVFEKE